MDKERLEIFLYAGLIPEISVCTLKRLALRDVVHRAALHLGAKKQYGCWLRIRNTLRYAEYWGWSLVSGSQIKKGTMEINWGFAPKPKWQMGEETEGAIEMAIPPPDRSS